MWIRSQDGKELFRPDRIKIEFAVNGWDRIYAYGNDRSRFMGEYASEAEARNVLDMMVAQHDMNVYEHGPEGMRVFQMPPKGFTGGE